MRIHHYSVPARDTEKVAAVLAEIFGARVVPLPHPEGTRLVYAGDADGTAIEVWPAETRGAVGGQLGLQRGATLPADWPHHAYVTTDSSDPERILAIFAREGWTASLVRNGPPNAGFSLVRGWIENHTCIAIGGAEMRAEYERFFASAVAAR